MAGNGRASLYVLDTSAWVAIDGNPNSNRILFVLEKLLEERRIKAPKQVFAELIRSGEYSDWAKRNRRKLTYPTRMNGDFAGNAGLVQHTFPGMGHALGTRERADPWIVAVALTENADGKTCLVVTAETSTKRPNRKIPGACSKLGVECIDLNELLEREDAGEE